MGPDPDVLVIGWGQAGLAMGYELAQRGQRALIVDANPRGRRRLAFALGLADQISAPV